VRRIAIVATASAAIAGCALAGPRVRATSSLDLYREARMLAVHVRGWTPCGRNDDRISTALANADDRLDAIEPWLSSSVGEAAFAQVQDEIGMEVGTFDPLCSPGGFDAAPGARRVAAITRELERRAAAGQRSN
jgi:hypothetical protein